MAIVTINTDTTWTTDQTNTGGYIVNGGATLTIDAVNSTEADGNIDVIFGAANLGVWDLQDDGEILLNMNNTNKIYLQGGASDADRSAGVNLYGGVTYNDTGDGTAKNFYLGIKDDGTLTLASRIFYYQKSSKNNKAVNAEFAGNYAYQVYMSGEQYFKNCAVGSLTLGGIIGGQSYANVWLEDSTYCGATYAPVPLGTFNQVGPTDYTSGKAHYNATAYQLDQRFWTRAFLRITDGTNPLSGMIVALMPNDNTLEGWVGITDANGKIDKTESRFGLDYLLALWKDVNAFSGTTIYAGSGKHTLVVVDPNGTYDTHTETHDMSSAWGSSGTYTDIALTLTKAVFKFDGVAFA